MFSLSLNRALLKYSLPLLPNAVCWWLLGSSSRLFIEHFLGLEANGIFAVAMKFSTILETFSVIVYQAWQETAIKQYGAADRSKFFSRIFITSFMNCWSGCPTSSRIGFKSCFTNFF